MQTQGAHLSTRVGDITSKNNIKSLRNVYLHVTVWIYSFSGIQTTLFAVLPEPKPIAVVKHGKHGGVFSTVYGEIHMRHLNPRSTTNERALPCRVPGKSQLDKVVDDAELGKNIRLYILPPSRLRTPFFFDRLVKDWVPT